MGVQVLIGSEWQDVNVQKMIFSKNAITILTEEGKTIVVKDSFKVRGYDGQRDTDSEARANRHRD